MDLAANPFDTPGDATRAAEAGAHLFIVGDSTNKLLHTSFCNQYLPEPERCAYGCSTPLPRQYPVNAVPYVRGYRELCPECDVEKSHTACCNPAPEEEGGVRCCADESMFRTAIACRPRWGRGSSLSVGVSTDTQLLLRPLRLPVECEKVPFFLSSPPLSSGEKNANAPSFSLFFSFDKKEGQATAAAAAGLDVLADALCV